MNCILQRAAIIGGLVLVLACPAALGQESRPAGGFSPVSTIEATCVLTITSGSTEALLNYDMLDGLLRSNGVLREAAREVGIPEERLDHPDFTCDTGLEVTVTSGGPGERGLSGVLYVRIDRDQPGAGALAERLMRAMCKRLTDVLGENGKAERTLLEARLAAAEKAAADAQRRLAAIHEMQQQVCDAAGQTQFSRPAVLEARYAAETQLRELDTKLVGLRARQKALAEQVARIGQEAEKATTSDAVAAELEKVVKFHEAELERARTRFKAAVCSEQDVDAAEVRLAEARAELARQRQVASANAGGNLLAEINKEVLTLAVDIAETEARREFVSKQLTQTYDKKLLELADRYEREVEIPLPAARTAVERATRDLEDIRARVQEFRPPTVTILGGAAGQ